MRGGVAGLAGSPDVHRRQCMLQRDRVDELTWMDTDCYPFVGKRPTPKSRRSAGFYLRPPTSQRKKPTEEKMEISMQRGESW